MLINTKTFPGYIYVVTIIEQVAKTYETHLATIPDLTLSLLLPVGELVACALSLGE